MNATMINTPTQFTGFKTLKRIDQHNTTPQRLRWLWEHMSMCEQSFDDFTRGNLDFFLGQFADDDVECY
jgi:hypothetical protein